MTVIASLGAVINIAWAAGEALIIPYLLSLGVHQSIASFIWLVNPGRCATKPFVHLCTGP